MRPIAEVSLNKRKSLSLSREGKIGGLGALTVLEECKGEQDSGKKLFSDAALP